MSKWLKTNEKGGNMDDMRRFIIFLVCAVALIGAARVVSLRYQDRAEDFSGVQEWIDIGKAKVEEVTDRFSTQIAGQDWELESNYDIDTENWFDSEGATYSGSLENTKLSTGEIRHLVLQAAGCKVILIVTQEPDFYFSFENMKKVQAYQKESRLFIKVVRDTLLDKEEEKNILTLYVPIECVLESAELELGAGSVQIEQINAQKLDISVEAGKLTVDFLEAGEMTASLGAGIVILNNANLQNAKLSVGAGSMSIDGQITGNVDADCAMGSLQMNLQGNIKDFNYELQCMAGNIVLNGEKYSGINEGMLIGNAAEKGMDLDCTVGSMKIDFKED